MNSFQTYRTRREKVYAKLVRNIGDRLLGFYAVARFIERRGEYRDGSLARNHSDNATAHAALGRQSYVPCPPA